MSTPQTTSITTTTTDSVVNMVSESPSGPSFERSPSGPWIGGSSQRPSEAVGDVDGVKVAGPAGPADGTNVAPRIVGYANGSLADGAME